MTTWHLEYNARARAEHLLAEATHARHVRQIADPPVPHLSGLRAAMAAALHATATRLQEPAHPVCGHLPVRA